MRVGWGAVWGIALGWVIAALSGSARAEALPGDADVNAGVHAIANPGRRSEAESDEVSVNDLVLLAGIEVAGQVQLTPWFSLGLRAAGSGEVGAGGPLLSSDGTGLDRDLWFWRFSGQARFDPAIWPRGLWVGAELGAVVTVDSAVESENEQVRISATNVDARFLAGAVVGWDFAMTEHWLLGVDLRMLLMLFADFAGPLPGTGKITLPQFPYISLSPHLGYRW